VPIEALIERDSKGIYSRFLSGEIRDVAGMDLVFDPPSKPDQVIDSPESARALLEFAESIAQRITATDP